MRRLFIALGIWLVATGRLSGQPEALNIDSLVDAVRLDSLTSYVQHLTGLTPIMVEDTVLLWQRDPDTKEFYTETIFDTLVTLTDRPTPSNDVATYYLERTMEGFGLDSVTVIPHRTRPWIRNVVGVLAGSADPDRWYILCAHYDGRLGVPAADDNASGTAAVLEAARVLAGVQSRATILFVLWDGEEVGLVGSTDFAQVAADSSRDIAAVVNLDMIAWDGDDDHALEIHTNFASSFVANEVVRAASTTGLDVSPVLDYPGIRASDHAAFWGVGYPAVLLIEEYRGGDFNPYYHTVDDQLQYFNLPFFHESARLALASIARLAADPAYAPIVHADAKVYLEGAYAGGDSMEASPGLAAVLPTGQPFSDTAFDGTPLEFDGAMNVEALPPDAVDWVIAGLRTGVAPATEVPGSRRPAILLKDGTVADTNGMMLAFPAIDPGTYRIVIRHRNHLPVMSSNPLDLSDGLGAWDFTTSMSQAYTSGAAPMRNLGDGRFALTSGDANLDGQINAGDFNLWLIDTKLAVSGYAQTDFDLDAQVTVGDFNRWLANTKSGAASQVPE